MKTYLPISFLFILLGSVLNAQSVFWSDNFDAPAGGINNNNAGVGWSASTNTPGGGPNTSFFGFSNSWIIGSDAGACSSGNKIYINTFGNSNAYLSDVFTDKLIASPSISTVDQSDVFLAFSWRCDGVPGSDYGQLGLSSDDGANWTWLPQEYSGQETCTAANISIPEEYQDISTFKFAFRFISNATSCSTCDPPFNIDNIQLLGESSGCDGPEVDPGEDTQFCFGSSAVSIGGTPTASGGSGNYTYAWSPANGLSSTSVPNPLASPGSTTTFTVLVTDVNTGCTSEEEVTVEVDIPQNLTISPNGSTNICPGQSLTLTAAAGFTNYVWTTPSGNVSGAEITVLESGQYLVQALGSNGCLSTSSTINLNVLPTIPLEITPSGSLSICDGSSVTLTASNGFTGLIWSTPTVVTPGNSIEASLAGIYSVSGVDVNGCTTLSENVTISINEPEELGTNQSGNLSTCQGVAISLSADAGFTNYVWSTPLGSVNSSNTEASEAGTYSVSATDINGCLSTSNNITLAVNFPLPLNTTPSGNISTCVGSSIDISAEAGFSNYSWNSPDGPAPGNSISASTEGVYSVTAEDINGCISASEDLILSIEDEATIPVNPSGNISICPSQPLVITAAAGFENYTWNGDAGNSTLIVTEPGTYSVSASTANGCPATSEDIVVSVFDAIPLNTVPSGELSICTEASVSITADQGFSDYSWSGPQVSSSSNEIIANTEGSYSVTALDANGCATTSEPVSLSFFVAQIITTTPTGTTTICEGDELILSASDGFTDYIWTSDTLTLAGNCVTVSLAGTYTVNGIDENGCEASSNDIIVELINPSTINVSPAGPILRCPNLSVTLSASQGFTDYVWSPGNVQGTSYTLIDAGEYSVTATSPEGCTVTSNVVAFGFHPTPPLIEVTPNGPITICQGESVVLTADTGYTQYLWNTNDTGLNTEIDESGTYIVTANDSNNCVANSGSVQVIVDPVFLVETTPSGAVSICDDGEVVITAEAGLSNYQWSNLETGQEITIDQEGAYSVSALNENGCSGSSEAILVNFLDSPTASFSYEQTTGYNVAFDNTSTNGDSYLWTFPGGETSEEQNPIFDFLFDNSWPVSLVVCNDCGCDTLDTFVEVIKTSINDLSNSQIQVVHQNKTLMLNNLSNKPCAYELQVYNAQGQLIVSNESVLFSNHNINLGNVSSGIYIIQLLTENMALRKRLFLSEK